MSPAVKQYKYSLSLLCQCSQVHKWEDECSNAVLMCLSDLCSTVQKYVELLRCFAQAMKTFESQGSSTSLAEHCRGVEVCSV